MIAAYMNWLISKLRLYRLEAGYSFALSAVLAFGHILSNYDNIDVVPLGAARILGYALFFVAICAGILTLLIILRHKLLKNTGAPKIANKPIFSAIRSNTNKWLLLSAVIFVLYLPLVLLAHSVLSWDSWSSIRQVTGAEELSDHHPVIFTAFVGIFVHIGLAFGSLGLGTILFSLAQSAILAMVFAKVILFLQKEGAPKGFLVFSFIFYAVLPVNAMAGLVMWKDILFTGVGLLLLMMVVTLSWSGNKFFTAKNYAYFSITVFLFCALRHNALYAYVLFAALFAFICRRAFSIKKLILLFALPIMVYVAYSGIVTLIAKPGSVGEMLSVPMQQIARTVTYHGDSISGEDRTIINEILPYNQLGALYNPWASDPVKSTFRAEAFEADISKYASLWFRLAMQHKKTYVASFLYNTYGYLYPLYVSNSPTDILLNNYDQLNTPQEYRNPVNTPASKSAVEAYRDAFISIIPVMQNIGFYILTSTLAIYIAIIRKRKELLGVFIILVGMFFTVILGPINSEFRYMYIFCAAIPLIFGVALYGKSKIRP